jgi:hypothetical protein
MPSIKSNLSAPNTFTEPLALRSHEQASVSVAGTFSALVVLQRRFGSGAWQAVPSPDGTTGWSAPTEQTYEADESCSIRLGIPTGGFTNGTAVCRLGKG